ncbi:hypothetical protein JTB14_014049 [Gonioctena quinquepunctata]|nr:hypothetical protein JTB14_014049 [Gonioctena quinquepunctata]
MYSALDNSQPSLCVFIDLSKAFDTVSHKLLLESLENVGVRGICLDIFKNYLSDRPQSVKVDDKLSIEQKIEYGVPQGTVLGPILFNVYINSLFDTHSCGKITTYADDTAIFYSDKDWITLKSTAENDLKSIRSWFNSRLLTINAKKTFFLPICSNKPTLPTYNTLHVSDDFIIESTNKFKYLGIVLDNHLKWNFHIKYLNKKLQFLIYKFYNLRNILNNSELK